MDQDRRILVRRLAALFAGGLVVRPRIPTAIAAHRAAGHQLGALLSGTWSLQGYTYTSNNRTYSSPDEMEATAEFNDSGYSVEFATHIGAVGIRRTRRASESGTFSVDGDRIVLNAAEASSEAELGEEILSGVEIEGDVMTLVSNNGITQEVWNRVPALTSPSE